jgi:hypothetical protein
MFLKTFLGTRKFVLRVVKIVTDAVRFDRLFIHCGLTVTVQRQ